MKLTDSVAEAPPVPVLACGATAGIREQAETDYRAMVFAVAKGESLNAEKLRSILWPLSRTLEDFENRVAVAKSRLDLAGQLQQGEALAGDVEATKLARDEAAGRLLAAEKEADRATEKASRAWSEADLRHGAAVAKHRNVVTAAGHLEGSADPDLARQIAGLESNRCSLSEVVRIGKDAAARQNFLRGKIDSLRGMKGSTGFCVPHPDNLEREAMAIENDVAKLQTKVEAGEAAAIEIATIDPQIAELWTRQHDAEGGMAW
ncbi:MAG: hypothetical protein KKE86_13745 [Planctomycetes bacterium]|nr:hypothetical protein [Planctomycetota bacterium]MBU4400384.1 hypothetical protein [Planctomycetota bacterium]MCG2682468.1 hypothetical protein [Planctomycetales bacterium]